MSPEATLIRCYRLRLSGFGNMDASALLSRMERLSQEVSTLRGVMETQANVTENLGLTTAALERRLTDIETPRGFSRADETAPGPKQRETQASGRGYRETMQSNNWEGLRINDPCLQHGVLS